MSGANVSDLAIDSSSIRLQRRKLRFEISKKVKSEFKCIVLLVIHWDGNLLHDLTSGEHVDRLFLLVSGRNTMKLLTVAKLTSGTGEA